MSNTRYKFSPFRLHHEIVIRNGNHANSCERANIASGHVLHCSKLVYTIEETENNDKFGIFTSDLIGKSESSRLLFCCRKSRKILNL